MAADDDEPGRVPTPAPRAERVPFDRLFAAAIVLVSGALGLRPLIDNDVFFHLFLGRAVLAAGSRTVPEPAAFTDFSDPCVVPEWLWAVLTYGVHAALGLPGLVALGVLGAIGCALTLLHLARRYGASPWATLLVAGLAMLVAQDRMTVRPELAALVWLPMHLALGRELAEGDARARLRSGVAIVVGAFVWAQTHGSVVLAPVIFAIQLLPDPRQLDRERLRHAGLVLVLLLAATCSTAYGLGIVGFVFSHGFSGAAAHVAEMAPMTWAAFHPGESPPVLGYLALLALGVTGVIVGRRAAMRELLLVLLGAALVHRGQRFVTEAAILSVPLAALGASELSRHFMLEAEARLARSRGALALVLVGLAVWTFRVTGTRFVFDDGGLAPGVFPILEARFLAGTPEGSNVYTDYTSSALLGFHAQGRYRVYVDGRTPLYFDEVDFGMLRDQMLDADALRRGLVRYHAVAAVMRRDRPACMALAEHWETAFVGPRYTVFRPGTGGRAHTALAPCGPRFFVPGVCPAGDAVEHTAQTIERLGDPAFANLVRAAFVLECSPEPGRAEPSIASFEPRSDYLVDRYRRLHVRALLAAGQHDEAAALMSEAMEAGDLAIVRLLEDRAAARFPLDRAEALLREHARLLDDQTEPAVRAALAGLCVQHGDEDCAREHAMRAAVLGVPTPALDWLAEHHSSARARADAAAWREVLARERAAAPPPAPGGDRMP
ncbi:MAG: hypothetical protein K1X94_21890 [Sandaracinaceae bacterium]|nr:hypothetical protein [Sandaracinaceae bacterium]